MGLYRSKINFNNFKFPQIVIIKELIKILKQKRILFMMF